MITDAEFEAALEDDSVDPLWEEIEAMSDEQVTLSNARNGISPEDARRSLDRAMAKFKVQLAVARTDEHAIEAMINEGGR